MKRDFIIFIIQVCILSGLLYFYFTDEPEVSNQSDQSDTFQAYYHLDEFVEIYTIDEDHSETLVANGFLMDADEDGDYMVITKYTLNFKELEDVSSLIVLHNNEFFEVTNGVIYIDQDDNEYVVLDIKLLNLNDTEIVA